MKSIIEIEFQYLIILLFFFKGISYHITDIYLEELVKYGEKLKPIRAVKMIQIFVKLMAISKK